TAPAGAGSRYKIISRYRGYHGTTLGALSATAYLLTQGEMIRDLTEAAFVLGEYKTYQVKVSRVAALTGFDFSALEAHDPLRAEPESLFGRAARPLDGAASLTL
ncbi:MAG: hypothetical protein AAFW01_18905, partial [Pseudomonadota bacterium]